MHLETFYTDAFRRAVQVHFADPTQSHDPHGLMTLGLLRDELVADPSAGLRTGFGEDQYDDWLDHAIAEACLAETGDGWAGTQVLQPDLPALPSCGSEPSLHFTADLTPSYTNDEFTASNINYNDESTTYLTRWTGSTWESCPAGKRSRDITGNTATCGDVTAFSTWAIAGDSASPTAVTLVSFTATPHGGPPVPWGMLVVLALLAGRIVVGWQPFASMNRGGAL